MSDDLKQKKSDYLLELGLEEQMATDEEIQRYIELEKSQPPHQFSKRHQRRMKKLFKMVRKMENREKYRRRRIHMAAGFIVFFLVAGVMVTQVEAFRVPLVRFFTQIGQESTLFGVSGEEYLNVTEKYQKYEPKYVPDGFYVLEVKEYKDGFYIKYMNDILKQNYTFYFSNDTDTFALDTEEAIAKEITIGSQKARLVIKNDEIRVLINTEQYLYYLSGKISIDEAMKIMESVE